MIVNDVCSIRLDSDKAKKYTRNGVIVDSFILTIHFLDSYIIKHPDKRHLLATKKITSRDIDCLNAIFQNLKISKIIITPHILSEFLNRLRNDYKEDYKTIKREFLGKLEETEEIQVAKDKLIRHRGFIDFGNDISLSIVSDEQIKKFKHCALISQDGRFLNAFFEKSTQVLAFDLSVLRYFY